MAFSRGVGPAYASNSGGITTVSCTLNSTTIGRHIVITVIWQSATTTITSITISGESNATVIAGSLGTNATTPERAQQAYLANNTAGGNKTITATFSGSTAVASIGAMEYLGGDTASFEGAANAANANSGNPTVSLTTTAANSLIVATSTATGGELTAGSGYTLWSADRPDAGWFEEDEDDLDSGAAGARTVDFSSSSEWVISAVEYKIPSTGSAAALSGSASTGGHGTAVPGIEIGL